MSRGGGLRLPRQAGEHGPVALFTENVVASMRTMVEKSAPATSSRKQANVLLVDDQPAKLLTYEAILSDMGANLVSARTAREALEQLLKHEFAVVIVDVCLPDLDGFELA